MIKIIFKKNTEVTEVSAEIGDTILEVAKKNNIKLYGGCDGSCICGSCHVHIDENYVDKVKSSSEESDEELDILDILDNCCDQSRLACQVKITEEMDGMIVVIPSMQ